MSNITYEKKNDQKGKNIKKFETNDSKKKFLSLDSARSISLKKR